MHTSLAQLPSQTAFANPAANPHTHESNCPIGSLTRERVAWQCKHAQWKALFDGLVDCSCNICSAGRLMLERQHLINYSCKYTIALWRATFRTTPTQRAGCSDTPASSSTVAALGRAPAPGPAPVAASVAASAAVGGSSSRIRIADHELNL